ncbi:nuclear transport factor 2 family protein [Leucobacter ruminantium]|uniref:Nuclear transport factor 2 family protein n=1 Tax=Leucobacter ruminantium TaxID=1289170 RepID=A0A939LXT7_9MICO|nr:nuclear transport factor 2 family protein [Leucobacter ruminantium]MBO1806665.1 nuclear transport factor 2 family protein [Leucobacter ruminantium]
MTTPQIPEPVSSFIAKVNAHDEQAFLDAFASDGEVDDWGRSFIGRDAIQRWSQKEFIGSQGVLAVEEVQDEGATVTVVGDWRSTHANGRSKFIFEIRDGLFTKMTIREG